MAGDVSRENGKLGGRPVAGHTLEAAKLREFIVNKVALRGEELLAAKFDLALGHKKLHITREGEELVYVESPDANSIRYLLDQTIGKATESMKIEADINLKLDI